MKMINPYKGTEGLFREITEIILGEEKKKKERRIYHLYTFQDKGAPCPTSKDIAFLTPENVLLAQREVDICDTSFIEELSHTAYLLNSEVYSVKINTENYLEFKDLLDIADLDDYLEAKRFEHSLDRNKDDLVYLFNKLSLEELEDLETLIEIKVKEELQKLDIIYKRNDSMNKFNIDIGIFEVEVNDIENIEEVVKAIHQAIDNGVDFSWSEADNEQEILKD